MNIRKPTDYSILFSELDRLMAEQLSQMNLYCEIGRLVSSEAEKGAAVVASEHLRAAILRLMAFLSAICVCGRFTRPMKNPLKSHGWR